MGLKHVTEAFFVLKENERFSLYDITEDGLKENVYLCAYLGGEFISYKVLGKSSKFEDRVKTSKGVCLIDNMAKNYIAFLFAKEEKIPILRNFTIFGQYKIRGTITKGKVKNIPIISTIKRQNIKRGTVDTSDSEVFFLDWISSNEKFASEIKRLEKMLSSDVLFNFLGDIKGINLFSGKDNGILASFLYQVGRNI